MQLWFESGIKSHKHISQTKWKKNQINLSEYHLETAFIIQYFCIMEQYIALTKKYTCSQWLDSTKVLGNVNTVTCICSSFEVFFPLED